MLLPRTVCLIGLLRWRGGAAGYSLLDPCRFPACEQTGLHRVHPTWAGTFALAALVALFPGVNFILLDSDCLPVTLFEAADLWREAVFYEVDNALSCFGFGCVLVCGVCTTLYNTTSLARTSLFTRSHLRVFAVVTASQRKAASRF